MGSGTPDGPSPTKRKYFRKEEIDGDLDYIVIADAPGFAFYRKDYSVSIGGWRITRDVYAALLHDCSRRNDPIPCSVS